MIDGPERHETAPEGLGPGGTQVWADIAAQHTLDVVQVVTLTEICRVKDRLDKLDAVLRGDATTWLALTAGRRGVHEVNIDAVLTQANATANLLKQLVASLRLPDDVTGKRPQKRSGARNAPVGRLGTVSSLDRARENARG